MGHGFASPMIPEARLVPPSMLAPRPTLSSPTPQGARLDGPRSILDMQRRIGNQAVTGVLAERDPGRPSSCVESVPSLTSGSFPATEDRAEQDGIEAANATLEKSRRIARSHEGSGRLPPMSYWFAKLYEFITEAEIAERGRMRYPGFMLQFIPFFYDLYEYRAAHHRVESPTSDASPPAPGGKQESAPQTSLASDALDVLGDVSDRWTSRAEPEPWRGYTDEVDLSEDIFHHKLPIPISRLGNPMYLLNPYIACTTESVLAGVSAHVNGDMANALVHAYEGLRDRYWGAGPFDKYRDDFFERNRPVFQLARERLVDHLLGKLGADWVKAPWLLSLGDSLGVGGPRVDEIYVWRDRAWTKARAEIDRRSEQRSSAAASGPIVRRAPSRLGFIGTF